MKTASNLFARGRAKFLQMALPLGALAALSLASCKKDGDGTPEVSPYAQPTEHLTGVPALSGLLDHSKFTMSSVVQFDLNRNVARVPLFKGTYNGATVWYVRMDVSDVTLARDLGLNFAPRLANADTGCPECVQTVKSTNPILGRAPVEFAGTVDFAPVREVVPSATGFPPLKALPGSKAGPGYSDLVRVAGSNVVFNAPIVATGRGPFDVSQAHTNTLDRVTAIDTLNKTVDLQVVRAFSHGKDIFYFSFSSTDALTATLERGTFVPAMAGLPFPNDDENPKGARSAIFTFTNGKRGLNNPNAQGLMHVILDNAPGNVSPQNLALFETLRQFGDTRNVLGSFPTLTDQRQRELYSPLWDLHMGVWSDEVVAKGQNFAQTDANTIRQLAVQRLVTNPGGMPLISANIVINCPAMGFATTPPTEDQAPRPKP